MSAELNAVFLIARLTKNPELRYTQSGSAVASMSGAVNRSFMSNGEKKEETSFVDVTVWGKTAEACSQYTRKGSLVFIQGRLNQERWETNEGEKRSKIVVVADRVQFLDNYGDEDRGGNQGGGQWQGDDCPGTTDPYPDIEGDSVPF